jgi:hypothetical protein
MQAVRASAGASTQNPKTEPHFAREIVPFSFGIDEEYSIAYLWILSAVAKTSIEVG